MSSETLYHLSSVQQVALVILRTLIGWHFLYEGYYKLMLPGWRSEGTPLGPWTSAGYLKAASGPLARAFQRVIDATVKVSLLLIGLSLILGLFTKAGCRGALFSGSFLPAANPVGGNPSTRRGMGRGLIAQCQKEFIDLKALREINPAQRLAARITAAISR